VKTTEIRVGLKLLANPKQYHSLTVEVSTTRTFEGLECPNNSDEELAEINAIRRDSISKALVQGIYEEIKKLYGEPSARAALVGYFGQGGTIMEDV